MRPEYETFSMDDAAGFKRDLLAAVAAGDRVVDLSSVHAAESVIIAVLLAGKRRSSDLKIINASEGLCQLAELYGVDKLLGLKPQASS